MSDKSSKNKNIIEKVINILLNVLIFVFGIILLVSIYTGIQTKLLGKKYTDFFGYSIFEVETGSMKPTINPGDWIITRIGKNIKLDDIITYESGGEYITHRVVQVYDGTYITKGDANNAKDNPVDEKQVVGKEVGVLSNFGIIRKTLFNPVVIITLIITLFLLNLVIKKNKEDIKMGKDDKKTIYDIVYSFFVEKVKPFVVKIYNKLKNKINSPKKDKTNYNAKVSINVSSVPNIEKSEELDNDAKEERIGKTSLFRVVSVNANDVKDNDIEASEKEESPEISEEELSKTAYFRVVSVDADEVDSTRLEIADRKINNKDVKPKTDTKVKEEVIIPEVKEEDPTLGKVNLSFLKGKKAGQNVIDTASLIKKEELNEIIDDILDIEKMRPNESVIRTSFMNSYIDAKYYNYIEDDSIASLTKGLVIRLEKVINKLAEDMIKSYKGSNTKYNELVNEYAKLFVLLANLEKGKESIDEEKIKEEYFKKAILKFDKTWSSKRVTDTISDIIKIQKEYADILKAFLAKLETNTFALNMNKLSSKKNFFGLDLGHNISFSKVYSEYVIDKTYAEGIVAEDKVAVIITLLLVQLVKDMQAYNFDKKYILYIPSSLYDKDKKLDKILKMLDNKYIKESVYLLVSYETLIKNKQKIKNIHKLGYKIAVGFSKDSSPKEKDKSIIFVADYLFINKKAENSSNITTFIPEELSEKIIYENIADKVGDFGSE